MAGKLPGYLQNLTVLFPGSLGHHNNHFPQYGITTTPYSRYPQQFGFTTPHPFRTTTFKYTFRPPRPPPFILRTTTTTTQLPTTTEAPGDEFSWDDATWVLLNAFFIFTMQTGFGLFESGCCSPKNEAHILMKNVVDIVLGGLTYWMFCYSFSFGEDPGSNPFIGVGSYLVDANYETLGVVMSSFFFQLSFATTATTIVSGMMAERCNFIAYCVFSTFNTIVYAVPARWIWGPGGFLSEMGVIDIAGSGAVHLLGGACGYVAAWFIGPRLGRYEPGIGQPPLGNPINCIVGTFILWWAWLAFNSGSTFGVTGVKWAFAARACVTTIVASIGAGVIGSLRALTRKSGLFDIMDVLNGILGGLVAITAGCAVYHTFDALIVGMIGAIVTLASSGFADWTGVDDPVGATAVHGFAGIWGMLAIGLFTDDDKGAGFVKGYVGLFRGGSFYLLAVQALACICIIVWASLITFIMLWMINLIIKIRVKPHEELLGADFMEHLIRRKNTGIITPALDAFGSRADVKYSVDHAGVVGQNNPRHDSIIMALNEMSGLGKRWTKEKHLPKLQLLEPKQPTSIPSFPSTPTKSLTSRYLSFFRVSRRNEGNRTNLDMVDVTLEEMETRHNSFLYY